MVQGLFFLNFTAEQTLCALFYHLDLLWTGSIWLSSNIFFSQSGPTAPMRTIFLLTQTKISPVQGHDFKMKTSPRRACTLLSKELSRNGRCSSFKSLLLIQKRVTTRILCSLAECPNKMFALNWKRFLFVVTFLSDVLVFCKDLPELKYSILKWNMYLIQNYCFFFRFEI